MLSGYCVCVIPQYCDLITLSWVCRLTTLFRYHFFCSVAADADAEHQFCGKTLTRFPSVPVRALAETSGLSRSWRIHFLKSCYSVQQLRQTPHVFSPFDSVLAMPFWTRSTARFSPVCLCQLLAVLLLYFPLVIRLVLFSWGAGCTFRNASDAKKSFQNKC